MQRIVSQHFRLLYGFKLPNKQENRCVWINSQFSPLRCSHLHSCLIIPHEIIIVDRMCGIVQLAFMQAGPEEIPLICFS